MNDTQTTTVFSAAHIVLDLETLSTQPHAIVASIGAVALTAQGEFVSEFHTPVICSTQPDRDLSESTCQWWDGQSDEAKAASILAAEAIPASEALQAFSAWVLEHANPKTVKVWGNGSNFDNVILSSLYADYPELTRPWEYWNDRDMRTLLDLHPHAKDVGPFDGIKHHALHDARHEAKQLAVVLKAAAVSADEHHIKFARLPNHPEVGQVLMRVEKDDEEDEDKLTFTLRGDWLCANVGWTSFGFFFGEEGAPYRVLESMTDEAALAIVTKQIKEIRRMTGGTA